MQESAIEALIIANIWRDVPARRHAINMFDCKDKAPSKYSVNEGVKDKALIV